MSHRAFRVQSVCDSPGLNTEQSAVSEGWRSTVISAFVLLAQGDGSEALTAPCCLNHLNRVTRPGCWFLSRALSSGTAGLEAITGDTFFHRE